MKLAWPINAPFPPALEQQGTFPNESTLKEEDGGVVYANIQNGDDIFSELSPVLVH